MQVDAEQVALLQHFLPWTCFAGWMCFATCTYPVFIFLDADAGGCGAGSIAPVFSSVDLFCRLDVLCELDLSLLHLLGRRVPRAMYGGKGHPSTNSWEVPFGPDFGLRRSRAGCRVGALSAPGAWVRSLGGTSQRSRRSSRMSLRIVSGSWSSKSWRVRRGLQGRETGCEGRART